MQPRSPSKLICCTSADDNILMLLTQLTNSLQVRIFRSSEMEQVKETPWLGCTKEMKETEVGTYSQGSSPTRRMSFS